MAITIKPGADQSQLSSVAKYVNTMRPWTLRLNVSNKYEVYDPVSGTLAAACDTTKEVGHIISNLATYGHIQPGLTAP